MIMCYCLTHCFLLWSPSWIIATMFYLLPAGIASSSRLCCPPGWTDPQWSPAGTGERHRSPQIPDRAPGTHLHLQSIPQCIPVAQILGREQRASCLLTPSIFVAEVREPPHVAQTDDISTYGQEKLHLTAPVSSLLHLGLLVFGCTCFIHHPPKLCLNQIHCVQIFFAFIFIPNSVSCNEQLPQLLISSRWKLSPVVLSVSCLCWPDVRWQRFMFPAVSHTSCLSRAAAGCVPRPKWLKWAHSPFSYIQRQVAFL